MGSIVIFGGSGFIGTFLAERWVASGLAHRVVIADIRPPSQDGLPGIDYRQVDVREPIPEDLTEEPPAWIFNLAAVHREPGHAPCEYFDTNLAGAEYVTAYAENVGCSNILFTSSISVYGPTTGPTDEKAGICPVSPYGGSKYSAELIHMGWQQRTPGRRLMIVRPGVVYGPHDPGNIGRMVAAIQKGYFAFPGSMNIHKSYAYIYGLLDSMEFVIGSDESVVVYNYVETPTETLGEIAQQTRKFVGSRTPILSVPTGVLLPAAHAVQAVAGSRNPIHPMRVKKASLPTYIVPQRLMDMGFEFKYTFWSSLQDWAQRVPTDFPRTSLYALPRA